MNKEEYTKAIEEVLEAGIKIGFEKAKEIFMPAISDGLRNKSKKCAIIMSKISREELNYDE